MQLLEAELDLIDRCRACVSACFAFGLASGKSIAEAAIARGAADLIAFGRPFINNPDLPARFKNGWPLDEELDMSTWYSSGHGARGYTDFPSYEEQLAPA